MIWADTQRVMIIRQWQTLTVSNTFWGGIWGSAGCLDLAGRCSSCRSAGASVSDWPDCWAGGRDWSVWSADSRPRPWVAAGPGRSAGCPGWSARGPTPTPSPAASWRSSQPRLAGWHSPSPFALRGKKEGREGRREGETDRERERQKERRGRDFHYKVYNQVRSHKHSYSVRTLYFMVYGKNKQKN